MSFVSRKLALGALAAVLSLTAVCLVVVPPPLVVELDRRCYDLLTLALPPTAATGQIEIADIDEESVAQVGRWPWPRETTALLVRKLFEAKASVVVLDMVFPEPDNSRQFFAAVETKSSDQILAESLAAGKVVLGYYFSFEEVNSQKSDCQFLPPALSTTEFTPLKTLANASTALCSLPQIAKAAAGAGFLNAGADSDGIVRRTPLLLQYGRGIYPSLALASLASYREHSSMTLVDHSDGLFSLRLDGRDLALDQGADLLLRFRQAPFVRYSAASILKNARSVPDLRGKLILVGGSARGPGVSLATRAKRSVPGVELQATAIDNLLKGDYLRRPWWGAAFELMLAVFFALASILFLFSDSLPVTLGGLLGMVLTAWALSVLIMLGENLYVSPLVSTVTLAVSVVPVGLRNLIRQRQIAKRSDREVINANQFISSALGAVTAVRDIETGQHLVRIQRYVRSLCEELARRKGFDGFFNSAMIDLFVQVAPIHDVGKVGIPDQILRKPGPLTSDEFLRMKGHVTLGKEILDQAKQSSGLRDARFFQAACEMVYSHHERWDGSGYPLGLKGKAIPIAGRVLAVADVYDALVSRRPYKGPVAHDQAVEQIAAGRGIQFDPDVVDAFLQVHHQWPKLVEDCNDENEASSAATN